MNDVVKLLRYESAAVGPVDHPLTLQPASKDIWDKKYRLKKKDGTPVDMTVDDTYKRVAAALASVENEDVRKHWAGEFLWALRNGAIPAGRILSNAGAQAYKPKTSLINCTVAATVRDSMDAILRSAHDAGMTLKAGSGIGYCFSTLRPKGAFVAGAGASTSGPLSFMDIFDRVCATVSSAGGRRGAQMATFDVGHPDIEQFVRAKREDGRLRMFNLSVLVTQAFIDAVHEDGQWPLAFPVMGSEKAEVDLDDPEQVIWRNWPIVENDYTVRGDGKVACRVYKRVEAKKLWNLIMASSYDYAEPGFILVDQVNAMNNNWWCESIWACNPCGEQQLPPNGACLLGSVDLTKFVLGPFTSRARFDMPNYVHVVQVFTRMLDNVVELNGLPLDGQRREIVAKRRHGMGFLGLGSTLAMLGMRYGSSKSLVFTDTVSKALAVEGWRVAVDLAKEKGPAPVLAQEFDVTPEMLAQRPQMMADGYAVGDMVPGRVLHAKYSRYMQQFADEYPELIDQLATVGARFTHHTSIAPTGTISLSLANNVSNGIEPSFAHSYSRNIIREGRKTKERVEVQSFELMAYRAQVDPMADPNAKDGEHQLPDVFVSAADVAPAEHVAVQAAAQKWIDSSISKTINVPTSISFQDFAGIYLDAAAHGLKGCTTFRYNPEAFQGVLVKDEDLANTEYVFSLEDGSEVRLKGGEEVQYDGGTHTAANLFDALKEGYYGKY